MGTNGFRLGAHSRRLLETAKVSIVQTTRESSTANFTYLDSFPPILRVVRNHDIDSALTK